ncbi:MAG TPA: hypothetical protein VKO87_06895 [Gemmatimonadaceae bacterium]|nr:hypothetical protein [Gemmatimonadaceae bacterium]
MKTVFTLAALAVLPLLTRSNAGESRAQGQVWQADIQVRTVEVTKSRTTMTARIVVYSEKDDEARDSHLIVLLPLGVGIDKLGAGCAATAGPSMLPSLRATVECDLGSIPNRGVREAVITTTIPPDAVPKRFGVFVYSSTPDPVPGNNYAERTIQ